LEENQGKGLGQKTSLKMKKKHPYIHTKKKLKEGYFFPIFVGFSIAPLRVCIVLFVLTSAIFPFIIQQEVLMSLDLFLSFRLI
jgi:hypothetical protein